ncbi:MAG: methyltransferase domain-containing protein, partial [Chloroflexi bacterium]
LSEADASVDAVTIGFGLRNLVNRDAALREMRRVLRPDRRLVILEFAPPTGPLLAAYRLYLGWFMPAVAGLFSAKESSAYRYLAETVAGFPPPAVLARELEGLGFQVNVEQMTLGIVAFHIAVRRD